MPLAKPFIVQSGTTVIGAVALTRWDDGMAVAGGLFRPNAQYVPQNHATELNGTDIPQANALRLSWADGRPFHCEAVSLVDWSSAAGEDGREIAAFGVLDSTFFNDG